MRLSDSFFDFPEGKLFIHSFESGGLIFPPDGSKFLGHQDSVKVFDKYFDDSFLNKINIRREDVEKSIKEEEKNLFKHEIYWDGESTPLETIKNDGNAVVFSAYGVKYSFGRGVKKFWHENFKEGEKYFFNNPHNVDAFMSTGFGVEGLIHTADDKIVYTKRSSKAAGRSGFFQTSFNEGVSNADADSENSFDIMRSFKRGMEEELGLHSFKNINIVPHSIITDVSVYEWGVLAYVDATNSNLTIDKLKALNPVDGWEFSEIFIENFTEKNMSKIVNCGEKWIPHSLGCLILSTFIAKPEMADMLTKQFPIKSL